jgi:hypothetical protein
LQRSVISSIDRLFQSFVELQARRDFAAGVTRGKVDLKLNNPAQTPITNLIENAVIEVIRTMCHTETCLLVLDV